MPLEMIENCMICDVKLGHASDAHICSYECTFCTDCTTEMDHICPNCGGELVSRPKRRTDT